MICLQLEKKKSKQLRYLVLPHIPLGRAAQRAYTVNLLLEDLQPRALVSHFLLSSSKNPAENMAPNLIIKMQINDVNASHIIPDVIRIRMPNHRPLNANRTPMDLLYVLLFCKQFRGNSYFALVNSNDVSYLEITTLMSFCLKSCSVQLNIPFQKGKSLRSAHLG